MKAFVLDPLAILGMMHGYRRPLDGSDLSKDRLAMAESFIPGARALHRFSNLSLIGGPGAAGVDIYGFGTTQLHPLGTIAVTRDGRVFRYCSAGAADLVAGNVIQSPAPIANHLALTSAAQAIGDGVATGGSAPIAVTPGNTAGAANLYAEGTLQVSVTPGLGQVYRVSGHAAITASTLFNLYLDPDDRLQTAFTTATRYGLLHNPWKTTIQTPTTLTAGLAGVAISPITANTTAENYGWLQTRGPASVLINGTPGVGVLVMNGATTAGSVDVITTTNLVTSNLVGRMMQVGVSTKNNAVFLMID